ncbi:MAG: ferrous iron transport protein A [Endomicrobia bacterium]|nr:ferrous iron transport protein A [Endomicrobiia bacterium]MCX7941065.1 ferrous iron transport protein A [Endomicrobiia bacterium]MDW8055367.1 FeoA family protein [Elusimicrobiota bacterium]
MKKDLTQVKAGQKYKIVEILGGHRLQKKLDALGIRIGIEIKKITSISSKGPIIIQIAETQLALGYGIAKKIIVEGNM